MYRLVFLTLAICAPVLVSAQDGVTQLGWCRMDGVNGGNVTRGAIGRACFGGPPVAATQEAAIEASQDAAAPLCPPVDAANAAARCAASGSSFAPQAVPTVQFTQSDGINWRERAAVAVQRVGNSGACTFSRVTESTTDNSDGTCQSFWGSTWPKASATVFVRSYCGYVCR